MDEIIRDSHEWHCRGFLVFSGNGGAEFHLPGQIFVSRRPEILACRGIGQYE